MTTAPETPTPASCSFVIFGVTGDLAHRLVTPALYNLAESGLLPNPFVLVGITRKKTSAREVRKGLVDSLNQYIKHPIKDEVVNALFAHFTCLQGDTDDDGTFDGLRDDLEAFEKKAKSPGNRIFYLATPPSAFEPIAKHLGRTGLLREDKDTWRRLIIEKPFGTSYESAKTLNKVLLDIAKEDQLYRIDHYLGKETVQNILVMRFSNGMFEPIWSRHHIDHVQITVDESLAVGTRGSFYDATGALRDMVPNHLFQLLSLVAMEPPIRFDAHAVRSAKSEVLEAIQIQTEAEALRNSVRGQYTAGRVKDERVPAYRDTKDVHPDSTTETYVALKLMIDNWRWAGVPFYLRTGKVLADRRSEVVIKFRNAPFAMFRDMHIERPVQNDIVIGIEPAESVSLHFNSKVPGPSVTTRNVAMTFCYQDYFKVAPKTGYETLLYDCMLGDNILFQRADGVEAGWQAVEPFLNAWKNAGSKGLVLYPAGSNGPDGADDLLARDGREWRKPQKSED